MSAPSTDLRPPKTIVLCFDGTSNEYDNENTNVVKFFGLLKKDDPTRQVCYYQAGVGTYFAPGVVNPLFSWGAKILDEAFAWYIYAHISAGYNFLMQNYVEGDRVCLFGFSRGAYTARALAGMLHKVGLLPADNTEQLSFAYKLYSKTDAASIATAAGFKRTFCRTVNVEFVGVWETVASVGVIMSRTLPFSTSNTTIKTFRQALALDEHRVRFLPSLYPRPSPNPEDDPHSGTFRKKQKAPRPRIDSSAPPPTPPKDVPMGEAEKSEGLLHRFLRKEKGEKQKADTKPVAPTTGVEEAQPEVEGQTDAEKTASRTPPWRRFSRKEKEKGKGVDAKPSEENHGAGSGSADANVDVSSAPPTPPKDGQSQEAQSEAPAEHAEDGKSEGLLRRFLRKEKEKGKEADTKPLVESKPADSVSVDEPNVPPTPPKDEQDQEAQEDTEEPLRLWRRYSRHDKEVNVNPPDEAGAGTDPGSDSPSTPTTDVLQVWFSGVHTDVGGGSVADDAPHALGNITLRWMLRQVAAAQAHVVFNASALALLGVEECATVEPPAGSVTASPSELAKDAADALAPGGIHDQLQAHPLWWLLEILPMPLRYQDTDGVWKKKWSFHLGRGRDIMDPAPNFHVTVKERIEDPALKYTPRAQWTKGTEVYVE